MQLSLPVPVSPEPAGATASAGAANPVSGVPGQLPVGSAVVSFDQFLPATGTTPKPAAKEETTDAEKNAAMLVASFWMPAVTPPPPVMPATDTPGTGQVEASTPALVSVFFASPSARAFVPSAPGSFTVTPGKSVPVVATAKGMPTASTGVGTVPADLSADPTVRSVATMQSVLPAATGQGAPLIAADQSVRQPLPVGNTLVTEKIAAAPTLSPETFPVADLSDKKDFLNTGYTAVTMPAASVGISVAHMAGVMPAVLPNRSKSVATTEPVAVGAVSIETRPVLSFAPEAPAPTATLRETMAAVVTAIAALDRHEGLGQKMLDLQFHVGDERLALRVELKDGTVHTTFHTESAEMRSALTQEWQAVVPSAVGREIRLAEPVFNSSPTGGDQSAFSSLGQGAPHQRGQAAPEPVASALMPDFSDPVVVESISAATATPGSTPLLQAFA
jgi:hypothetical protein